MVVTRGGKMVADTQWTDAARAAAFRDAYVVFLRGRGLEPRVTTDGGRVRVEYQCTR